MFAPWWFWLFVMTLSYTFSTRPHCLLCITRFFWKRKVLQKLPPVLLSLHFYFQAINLHMVCKEASSGVVLVPSFDENDKLWGDGGEVRGRRQFINCHTLTCIAEKLRNFTIFIFYSAKTVFDVLFGETSKWAKWLVSLFWRIELSKLSPWFSSGKITYEVFRIGHCLYWHCS